MRRGWLLLLVLLAAPAAARGQHAPDLESRARHWASLSEPEREVLRRRFELLRGMEPERRDELRERWRQLETIQEELSAEPDGPARPDLDEREGRRAWREHVRHRLEERGRHLLELLPAPVRTRLAEAPPEERQRLLHALRRGLLRRHGDRLVEELERRLELTPEERDALRALAPEERFQELRRLRPRRHGEGFPPPGPGPRFPRPRPDLRPGGADLPAGDGPPGERSAGCEGPGARGTVVTAGRSSWRPCAQDPRRRPLPGRASRAGTLGGR